MKRSAVLLTVVAIACAAPATEQPAAPAPPDPAAVRQTIEAANARQIEALVKGDVAGGLANYAEDAVFMFPGAPAVQGKAAMTEPFTGTMQSTSFSDATMHTDNVVVSGDLAVENGTYKWTITPKGAKPMADSGKYLTVWQQQADGGWKIIRDINNTDIAPKM